MITLLKRVVRLILIVGSHVYSIAIYSQSGFYAIYEMEAPGNAFHSISVIDDKLFVYGSARDTNYAEWWGIQLIELDTSGSVLKFIHYTDPEGAQAAANGIIRGGLLTMNGKGEMACTGGFLGPGRSTFVFKSDTTLDWHQIYELQDSTISSNIAYHISAYEDGFVVSGTRSKPGYSNTHNFIMKLNENFEEVLNVYEASQSLSSTARSSYVVENKIVSGLIFAFGGNTFAESTRYSEIQTIDSAGNVIEAWQSEIGTEEGIQIMTLAPDKGYIYSTMEIDFLPDNIFSLYPRLVRRDSTYQKLWGVELPVSGSDQNRVMGITRSLDGHWLVSAKLYTEEAGGPGYPRMAPCIFKISDAGEILWSTCVTFPFEWVNNQYPSFRVGNVIQISSGSMYIVGSVNRSNPSRTLGWMLKLDKDGCLDENPCHPPPDTSTTVNEPVKPAPHNLQIQPNPSTGATTLSLPEAGRLSVYDLQGRRIQQTVISSAELELNYHGNYTLHTTGIPAGIYVVVHYGESGEVYRGKLAVLP